VHLIEGGKFTTAGLALLQVIAKIESVARAGFAVQITNQVFGSMTNWSFACFSHDNSL
jgi:hypothetical protein